MDSFFKPLQEEGNRTQEERLKMRGVLQQYVDLNPLSALKPAATPAGLFTASAGWMWNARYAGALALFVAIIAGSTSYAAGAALPGDFLYPVKVGVNEKLQGVFIIGPKADADWDLKIAHERAQEIIALAQEDKLSTETRVHLESQFDAKIDRYYSLVDSFEKGKRDAVSKLASDLTLELNKLEDILVKIEDDEETEKQILQFKAKVASHLDGTQKKMKAIADMRAEATATTTATTTIDVHGSSVGDVTGTIIASSSADVLGTSTSVQEKDDDKDESDDSADDKKDDKDEKNNGDDKSDPDEDDSDENENNVADEEGSDDEDVSADIDVDIDLPGSSVNGSLHL